MKSLFRLLLFSSFIFLVGCTITKRKYTGGYSINWHNSKLSDTRLISHPSQTKYDGSNKVAHPTISPNITNSDVNTQKAIVLKKEQIIYHDKAVSKIIPIYKLISPSISYPHIAVPSDTVPEDSTPEKDALKRDARIARLDCLIAILSELAFFVSMLNPIVFLLSFIVSLIFFIISLVYSSMAKKGGHYWGLQLVVVLDIIFLIIWGISIYLLFTTF